MSQIARQIKDEARLLGFSNLGIVPARPSPRLDAFLRWIGAGMHGEMNYLARPDRVTRRQDLNQIVPGVQSVVIAGLDYFSLRLPPEITDDASRGRISNYAWNYDYHEVMLEKLNALASIVQDLTSADTQCRTYVDTGAILERDHGEVGGLGFIGKNTMLISPSRGSFFFLGEILTTAELPYDDPPDMPNCGTCSRCLNACPTEAFPAPYVLDARRCISYLTIELKGSIPASMRPLMGNWVYGCDVCQDVCPWQRFAEPVASEHFNPRDFDRAAPLLAELLLLDQDTFLERYRETPVARIGRDRLVRNACVAAGNSGSPALESQLLDLLEDEATVVRGHAAWALGQLHLGQTCLHRALQAENDDKVREEITAVLKHS